MKIHHFGLWFDYYAKGDKWLSTIPQDGGGFKIYYDGMPLGMQFNDFDVVVWCKSYMPLTIQLKNIFPIEVQWGFYKIGRRLTLDDFEIIPNPNYIGA
jgi:hypothetical protein